MWESTSVRISVWPRVLIAVSIWPDVCSSMSPASFVAVGVHVVLSSRSENATLRGLPLAPRANTKRSSVTIRPRLFVGALATTAAFDDAPSCHSKILPSEVEQAKRYSPQLSKDQVVAGDRLPVSGRGVPYVPTP